MAWGRQDRGHLTVEQEFARLTIEHLRTLARLLGNDPPKKKGEPALKGRCLPAGDRLLVVREADLAAVRKAVRWLGYVWPVPGE